MISIDYGKSLKLGVEFFSKLRGVDVMNLQDLLKKEIKESKENLNYSIKDI